MEKWKIPQPGPQMVISIGIEGALGTHMLPADLSRQHVVIATDDVLVLIEVGRYMARS